MATVIFAEVLDRHGRIKERVRIERFPATIGTAYSNNVILDDRYVAALEARVELNEQGEPVLCNAGSINGIVKRGNKQRVEKEVLESGDVFHIGHTYVRFMFADHPMPEPVLIKVGMFGVGSWASSPLVLMLVFLAGYAGLAMDDYLGRVGKFSLGEYFGELIAMGLGFLVMAGVWALGTRLVSHEFRLLHHLAVVSVAILLLVCVETVFSYIDFIYSPDAYLYGITIFFNCLVGVVWLFIHLCVVSRQAMGRKFVLSSLLVGVIFGMVQLQSAFEEADNTGTLEFSSVIKPHGQGLVSLVTIDELFDDAQRLKVQLELDVKK